MIDKIFNVDRQDSIGIEDLHTAMLESSDAIKFHNRVFDTVAYLLILASGRKISPEDSTYFDILAMDFDFRRVLKRMRKDPKVPCAGETILDEILSSS